MPTPLKITAALRGGCYETRLTAPAGETVLFQDFQPGRPATISVHAVGPDASAYVEASNSPRETFAPGVAPEDAALFYDAPFAGPGGTVTDGVAVAELPSPLSAIRVTATGTAAVVLEVRQ